MVSDFSRNRLTTGTAFAAAARAAAALAAVAIASSAVARDFWIEPADFQLHPGQIIGVRLIVGEPFKGDAAPRKCDRIVRFESIGLEGREPIEGAENDEPAGGTAYATLGPRILVLQSKPTRLRMDLDKLEAYAKQRGFDSAAVAAVATAKPAIAIEPATEREPGNQNDATGASSASASRPATSLPLVFEFRELYQRNCKSLIRVINEPGKPPPAARPADPAPASPARPAPIDMATDTDSSAMSGATRTSANSGGAPAATVPAESAGDAPPLDRAALERNNDTRVGLPLEIVCEANPFASDAQSALPIRVYFRGAPLANATILAIAEVARDDLIRIRTDRDGRAEIPISSAGRWLLTSVHMIAGMPNSEGGSAAEIETFWASTTFEIPRRGKG